MEIRAILEPWQDSIKFVIRHKDDSGHISTVKDLIFEPYEPGMVMVETGVIDPTAAQVLMDDLWAAGLRPTEGKGSAGSLKATEKHLEDMRRIVSKKLDVSL